jgi:hypothetical protein
MWTPQSTWEWVAVAYVVIGLVYAAYVFHQLQSDKGKESAEKAAGPIPSGMFDAAYGVACVLLCLAIVGFWPGAALWELSWKVRR